MTVAERVGVSREEHAAARDRMLQDASSRLVFGPAQALAAGCTTVFSLGCLEGSIYVRSSVLSSFEAAIFIFRYGLANVIPSLIWGRIDARTVADALKLCPSILHDRLPPRSEWRLNRLQSLRGAIAGSVVISQVFSMAQVATQARYSYLQRIRDGCEPPLNDPNQEEVVIRLSGATSDVTDLGFQRDGRRKYFPVFEQSQNAQTQQLVRNYGISGDSGVPIYWKIEDGQYGHSDSWRNMCIPSQWLFTKTKHRSSSSQTGKVLILEADATTGNSMSLWGLGKPKETGELDLDLYEAAQGFSSLRSLVSTESPDYDLLRVLLVDADAVVKSGGGRRQSVRDHVTALGLCDVIIDARAPLLYSLDRWLQEKKWKDDRTWIRRSLGLMAAGKKPVVLETPCTRSFSSIRSALRELGYTVMDMSVAVETYGSIRDMPILIYEKNTQATINTIHHMLARDLVLPENVCALCPTHHGLVELEQGVDSEIAIVCSSDVYDNLFRFVRALAVKGHPPHKIQQYLDTCCVSKANEASFMKFRLGFPTKN